MGFLLLTGIVLYHLSLGYGRKNTEIYLDGTDFLKRDDLIYKEGEPLLNSYRNAEYKLDKKDLKSIIKRLIDREFPRSHQIRIKNYSKAKD